jgi:ATPase family associated with various cellular activities (AAA)
MINLLTASCLIMRCTPLDRPRIIKKLLGEDPRLVQYSPATTDTTNSVDYLLSVLADPAPVIAEGFLAVLASLPTFDRSRVIGKITAAYHSGHKLIHKLIILETGNHQLPTELQQYFAEQQDPLPAGIEIDAILLEFGFDPNINEVARYASGLSQDDLRKGLAEAKQVGEPAKYLRDYRKNRFSQAGITFAPPPTVAKIGGLDLLQKEIPAIKFRFSELGKSFGLPTPRGWMLVGPPGAGKTHTAKVMSFELGYPMVMLSIEAALVGGIPAVQKAIEIAESLAPCIFYIDEADKFFETPEGQQVLGHLLTWMNDKITAVFVMMTLNRIEKMPIEITRSGRNDDFWFVDLPDPVSRKEILEIHIDRFKDSFEHGGNWTLNEWHQLALETNKFTGSELESLVEKTVTGVKMINPEQMVTLKDLSKEATEFFSMFRRNESAIMEMVKAIKENARPAQSKDRQIIPTDPYDQYAPISISQD